jgi:CBS domain-containing protein
MEAHVRTIMSGHIITVGPDDELLDACREIAAHGIGAVPVVDKDQHLVGIVSTTDLVNLFHDGGKLEGKLVREVMSVVPIAIDEFATADEAIGVMRNALIRHLPVTREGKLVGILTASDLIRHLLKSYPAPDVA